MISRRKFLLYSGITAAAGAVGAYGYAKHNETTEDLEVVATSIALPNLPREFEGFRIGFISDLHLGLAVRTELIEQTAAILKKSDLDLLALGGDYLWVPESAVSILLQLERNNDFKDLGYAAQAQTAYRLVSTLLQGIDCPDGTIAVFGNHDRWTIPKFCIQEFGKRSIQLLINESILIKRGESVLRFIGIDDYWTGIPHFPDLPKLEPNEKETRIALCHNPDFLTRYINRALTPFDLALCGHTHGGQIKLPLIGTPHYNIRDMRLREGLYEHRDCLIYTTRGIGVVEIPYRINCRPEVSILTLTQA